MEGKRKPAPQELAHRRLLKALQIKPLEGPPRHKESLPGQIELFPGDDDGSNETHSPEDVA